MGHPVIVWLLAAAAVLTALGVIRRQLLRPGHELMRRIVDFLDDWNGAPPRPGRPRREAMPDRMLKLEEHLHAEADRMVKLEEHLHTVTGNIERLYEESLTDRNSIRERVERLEQWRRRHESGGSSHGAP